MSQERTIQEIARLGRVDRLRRLKTDIKLVVWDFNGCILNDLEYMYRHGMCHIFNYFNLPAPTLDQYKNESTADFLKFYHKYGIPANQVENDLNQLLIENYRLQKQAPPVFEDVPDALQIINWQGIDQVLVTAFNEESTRSILKSTCLLNYFYDLKTHVSDKALIISEIIKECEIEPSNVIGITDTIGDIKAFIAAGIKPYICHRGFHSLEFIQSEQDQHPEMILVSNINEIMKLHDWI